MRMMSQEDDLTFLVGESSLKKKSNKNGSGTFSNSTDSAGYSQVAFSLVFLFQYPNWEWLSLGNRMWKVVNPSTARELRSKDQVAFGKTCITRTVKGSSAVILHRACLGFARPKPTPAELQGCLWTHRITVDVHGAGLPLALCSDTLGSTVQKIWLCRTSSRCQLALHEALWGWLLWQL